MSDTPKNADNCMKLLDNGWTIQMYRNGLGSYTAVAMPPALVKALENAEDDDDVEVDERTEALLDDQDRYKARFLTDDFTPSQALYRLTEKVFGSITWDDPES